MFQIIKSTLFCFSPESAHNIIIRFLIILRYLPFSKYIIRFIYSYNNTKLEREIMGMKFKNPIGLAAGFDKNCQVYNELSDFGFGFIEVGSLTPNEQLGNPKPRLFRLIKDKAIINRMGINNKGVKYAINNLKNRDKRTIVGANIIKSTITPMDKAPYDYEKTFSQLYDFVDYFVVNVSCPNVKDITSLQNISSLSEIIDRLLVLRKYYDDYRPILLKISPDLPREELDDIIELILASGIDGIVASNTTISRDNLKSDKNIVDSIGNGGLSGLPLYNRSLDLVKYIAKKTQGQLPIIAVGGIMTPSQVKEMLNSGASLVQIYTGFIYNGPSLIKKSLKYIVKNS